jgi:YVTN family beta-propeller protein
MKARGSDRSRARARVPHFLHGLAVFVLSLGLVSAVPIGGPVGPAVASTVEDVTEIKPGFLAPVGVAVTPDGTKVYVANRNDDTVSVIDLKDNNAVTTVVDPAFTVKGPWAVVVAPDGKTVYVTNSTDRSVSVIDTVTDKVSGRIAVAPLAANLGASPVGIAVNPAGTKLYVANLKANSVSVIDLKDNNAVTTVVDPASTVKEPWGIAVAPDGKTVYVTNSTTSSVSVIETFDDTVRREVLVESTPRGIAVNPAGTRVYVANWGAASVSVIDTSNNAVPFVAARVTVGTQPVGVAVNPAATRVYVTTSVDTVSVIDALSNSVSDSITVGLRPWGIAINPAGTRVYVANRNSDSVSVISLALPPSTEVSASEVSAGMPGIFLYIAGSPGRLAEGTPLYHGSANIAPNTSYTLSVQSMDARGSTKTVLATGTTKGRGTVNERSELGSLAAGSYKIVMTGYHPLGYPLVLTNHISVDAAGKLVSVSPESLQPSLR